MKKNLSNLASGRRRFRIVIPQFSAFNIYSGIASRTTALGPIYVGTMVDKDERWEVEIIDENNYRRTGPHDADGLPDHGGLQSIRPADVVGFYGGLTSTIPRLYDLAALYRERGVATIAGGQHFIDANIEEGLDHDIDFVVVGEGEQTCVELLGAIFSDTAPDHIAGIAFRRAGDTIVTPERPPLTDFNQLPLPDFSLLRHAKINIYPVSWARGCGMNCEFCTVKGVVRCPGPEYIFDQISSLVERHNARTIFMVDDLFGQRRQDALRLCDLLRNYQELIGVRLDIVVQMRLDRARDAVLLQAMRDAGISTIAVGFESPIPEELTAMNKNLKPDDMLEMTRLLHQAGFFIHGMFIFGYPMPAGIEFRMPVKKRIRAFRKFIRKGRLDTVQILLPVPLPGTEMTRRLAADNRIFPRDCVGWEYYDGNFPLFQPDPPLTPEDMQKSAQRIMGKFYRFRNMFMIAMNILAFPAMAFSLFDLKFGWRKWYRSWRNNIMRFSGWIIMRKWKTQFDRGAFPDKLTQAKTLTPPVNRNVTQPALKKSESP